MPKGESMTPIQCPFCSRVCSLSDNTCPKCGQSLDEESKMEAVGDALRAQLEAQSFSDKFDDLKPQTKKGRSSRSKWNPNLTQTPQKNIDDATPDDLMNETIFTVVRTIFWFIASLFALMLFGWFVWWATDCRI